MAAEIADLPDEVLREVLRRAMPFNLDYGVARVCKRWSEIAYDLEHRRTRWMPWVPRRVDCVAPHAR